MNNIILPIVFALLIADMTSPIKYFKKKFPALKIKPFDCAPCLSFWIALTLQVAEHGSNLLNFNVMDSAICTLAIVYCSTILLSKIYHSLPQQL